MKEGGLRRDLAELIDGGHAHVTVEKAFSGLAKRHRATRPGGPDGHSIWELLEHMRIAQEDILRYTLDPRWKSPKWPEGYWPRVTVPTEGQWRASLDSFRRDLGAIRALVLDPSQQLTAPLPHAKKHTALREVLLAADHNAYHLGQVVELRRRLGAWS